MEAQSRRVAPGGSSLQHVLDDPRAGRIVVDALYAGADTYLAGEAAILQAAVGETTRLFGGTQTFVQAGWLAAFAPRVAAMGAVAAEQMARIFAGADPADLPVILPPPNLFISQAAATRHGVTVPSNAVLLP